MRLRRHWLARSTAIAACLALITTVVTGSTGPRDVVVVLQMNLCASGFAGCYTGRSVQHAATLIKDHTPEVVAVNEVCRADVAVLDRAMREATGGGVVRSAFRAVPAGQAGRMSVCRDGQDYGVGLVVRVDRPYETVEFRGGPYPSQDRNHPEQRVFLCVRVDGRYVACTTHLAINAGTALAQCAYLLGTAVPSFRAYGSTVGALVTGDFNLGYDGLAGCTPPGYQSTTDGGLQHMLVTPEFTVLATTRIDMRGTTDHPGLLVTAVRRRA
jgi:endonuclease/exonuclease/phosphatase family metal-dependent hydrolase